MGLGIQIASLFASIGADTSGLDKGLAGAKQGVQDLGNEIRNAPSADFTSLVVGLNQAWEIAQKAAEAIKQVYAAAREGAAMEYSIEKFDRLAHSIGTTADLLLGDMRVATRGTASDMELVSMASQVMQLGLMTNHDQVVRLTKVAGALGMNMNQLVLTLANKTTMRFDQLGLSVAGFDDKVRALEQSGYDVNAAFGEGFLRQGEEAIGTVGEVADSTLGEMMQMEAAWKNLGDATKRSIADGFQPLVPLARDLAIGLNENVDAGISFRDVIKDMDKALKMDLITKKEYNALLREMGVHSNASIVSQEKSLAVQEKLNILFEEATHTTRGYADAQYDLITELIDESPSWIAFVQSMEEVGLALGLMDEQTFLAAKSMSALSNAAVTTNSQIEATDYKKAQLELAITATAVDQLAQAYANLELAQLGWQGQIAGMVKQDLDTQFKNGTVSVEDYRTALGNLDAQFGTQYQMQFELQETIPELTRTLLENPESFKENVIEVSANFEELDQNVVASTKLVEELKAMLESLKGTYVANVHVNVSTTGSGDWGVTPEGHAVGGPVVTNSPYIVGERGPELFVPQGSGYIMTNSQTANVLNGGNSDLSEVVSRIPTARDIAVAVRDALLLVSG